VLAAVRESGAQLDPDTAEAAGAADVSAEEVSKAIKRTKPNKAPGPDGIATEVWLRGGPPAHRLLARLFSAIGRSDHAPAGFLDGAVKPIFKAGDAADPANYRPITLLNSDHRLLAKVLALRLSPLLAAAIGPEQAGFLTGRRGSDNILALQLLPALLQAGGARSTALALSPAAVLCIDFAKAFDRVARPFLRDVMSALGARPGLLRWVSILLGDTWASAVVNGWISEPRLYEAGVRQGCPLSPLLYLFVAWALTCWLRTCPHVGVPLAEAGTTAHAFQYADDAQALLRSCDEATVQAVLAHLDTFGAASGQRVNPAKSKLLPLSRPPGPLPTSVAGVPVASSATILGATVASGVEPPADPSSWDSQVKAVKATFSKVSNLSLSVFGRAQAAASYGVSTLLFRAEHEVMPAAVADQLDKATKALVDRQNGALPGVHSALLMGKPALGGFGALPWKQHILARHAHAGFRFIRHTAEQPSPGARGCPLWVPMAAALLSRRCPASHPALALLAVSSPLSPSHPPRLPGPLQRMVEGLRAIGRPSVTGQPEPGPWCAAMPLWDNPHFYFEHKLSERAIVWPGLPADSTNHLCGFSALKQLPGLHSLADLLILWDHLDGWRGECTGQARGHRSDLSASQRRHTLHQTLYGSPPVFAPALAADLLGRWDPYDSDCPLWEQVDGICHAIPASWRAAARLVLPPTDYSRTLRPGPVRWPEQHAALSELLGCVGWAQEEELGGRRSVLRLLCPLRPFTVRAATALQLASNVAARAAAHRQFVLDALTQPPAPPPSEQRVQLALTTLRSALQQLWRFQLVENSYKETLWRLSVNGVPAAGGHGISMPGPCPCGWAGPEAADPSPALCWQRHHFWSCSVAQAVIAAVSSALPPSTPPLTRPQFWLLQAPPGVHADVWPTIAALALFAMDKGRRALWALSCNKEPEDGAQALITDFFPRLDGQPHELPEPLATTAGRRAVAWFWSSAQDVVFTDSVPLPWSSIGAHHPIFFVDGASLKVRLPPAVASLL
jgi:hypothetical protein